MGLSTGLKPSFLYSPAPGGGSEGRRGGRGKPPGRGRGEWNAGCMDRRRWEQRERVIGGIETGAFFLQTAPVGKQGESVLTGQSVHCWIPRSCPAASWEGDVLSPSTPSRPRQLEGPVRSSLSPWTDISKSQQQSEYDEFIPAVS